MASFLAFGWSMDGCPATSPRWGSRRESTRAAVLFHDGRSPLTRGRARMCSGLSRRLSSCSDRTRFPGQKRKPRRSRQQIRAGAAYGDLPSWSSVKTLVRDRVNIACLLWNPTPWDAAWRSFATRWRLGAREPEAERSGNASPRVSARCRTTRVRQRIRSGGPDWYADRAGGDAISPPRTRARSMRASFRVAPISTGSAGRTDATGDRHNDA